MGSGPRLNSGAVSKWIINASVGTLAVLVIAAVVMPVFACSKCVSVRSACMSDLKQQVLASLMYASDFDDKLPRAERWVDTLSPSYVKDPALHCPSIENPSPDKYGYAYYVRSAGRKLGSFKDPKTTVMFFDSEDLSRSAVSVDLPPADLKRHGGANVTYADGHARQWLVHARQ